MHANNSCISPKCTARSNGTAPTIISIPSTPNAWTGEVWRAILWLLKEFATNIILRAKSHPLEQSDFCRLRSGAEYLALPHSHSVCQICGSHCVQCSHHLNSIYRLIKITNAIPSMFVSYVLMICCSNTVITCPIFGLLINEWRTHAAAASIIRNISLSIYCFSSLGSANFSKSCVTIAWDSKGRACNEFGLMFPIWQLY